MLNVMKSAAASEAIEKMYLNEELADVHFKFEVDDEIELVPANKSVLAALSPVLRTMFFGSLKEGNEVEIVDAGVDAFKEFLQFFYLSEVTFSMENIEAVVRLADKYDVLGYVNACASFLKSQLTAENICWGYKLAVNLENEELIKFCETEIIIAAKEVFATNAFKNCEKSTLKRILQLGLICPEADVFDACLVWAKCACEQDGLDLTSANLRTQLDDCLMLIQFGSMKSEDFSRRYMLHKGLFTMEELEDIMFSLTVKEYEPNIFCNMSRGLKYNTKKTLKCLRKTRDSDTRKWIQYREVTSFSSNNRLLLVEVSTAHTHRVMGREVEGSKIDVTITERENLYQRTVSQKILHKGSSNIWFGDHGTQLKVILPQPILVVPGRVYEVCLQGESSAGNCYYSDCQKMEIMEDGTRIEFHRNPFLKYNNLTEGWIAELVFNKV